MPTRAEIAARLQQLGVVAVVRAQSAEQVLPLAEALLAGGIEAIEITLTTPNALQAIREASARFGSRALIGVGTVLDASTAREAMAAGAKFVVSPVTHLAVAAAAHAGGCPVMLGAYSPTECQQAWEAGADFIKLFPADTLGPTYVKAIRAPLPHLRIVPTGGVDLGNIEAFFKAGCAAVGVGSSMISPKLLAAGDWPGLTRLAAQYRQAADRARNATTGDRH